MCRGSSSGKQVGGVSGWKLLGFAMVFFLFRPQNYVVSCWVTMEVHVFVCVYSVFGATPAWAGARGTGKEKGPDSPALKLQRGQPEGEWRPELQACDKLPAREPDWI